MPSPNDEKNEILPQSVALLDIDDTLLDCVTQEINFTLLEQLKASGVTQIYLFTNMSPEDISRSLDIPKSPKEPTAENWMTRYALVKKLEDDGFTVRGVITPIDPVYNKGLGAAYENIFLPQYKRCGDDLTGETVGDDIGFKIASVEFQVYSLLQNILNATIQGTLGLVDFKSNYAKGKAEIEKAFGDLEEKLLTEKQTEEVEEIQASFNKIDNAINFTSQPGDSWSAFFERIKKASEQLLGESNWFKKYTANTVPAGKEWDKGAMYAYFLANKPEWVHSCIFFDDRESCLSTARKVNQELAPKFPLQTMHVTLRARRGVDPSTESDYEKNLSELTSKQFQKAFDEFSQAQEQKKRENEECYKKVGFDNIKEEILENNATVCALASKITLEMEVMTKTEGESRSHSELALLTTALVTATAALNNPNEKTLKACVTCAEQLDGKPSLGKKLVGLFLAFVGVLAIAAGITLSVAVTAATLGLAAPLIVPAGMGIASSGAVLASGGAFLFFNGRRKGFSNDMVQFAEALKKDIENKKTNLPKTKGTDNDIGNNKTNSSTTNGVGNDIGNNQTNSSKTM